MRFLSLVTVLSAALSVAALPSSNLLKRKECSPACGDDQYCDDAGVCQADYCIGGCSNLLVCQFGQCVPDPTCGNRCNSGALCNSMTGECYCGSPDVPSCNGQCYNLKSDPFNCGGCGNSCADGQSCADGVCRASRPDVQCPADQLSCDGACRNVMNDNNYCGDCLHYCLEGQQCVEGQCYSAGSSNQCPPGQQLCTKGCTNVDNDNDNCGACAKKCPDGKNCQGGQCV